MKFLNFGMLIIILLKGLCLAQNCPDEDAVRCLSRSSQDRKNLEIAMLTRDTVQAVEMARRTRLVSVGSAMQGGLIPFVLRSDSTSPAIRMDISNEPEWAFISDSLAPDTRLLLLKNLVEWGQAMSTILADVFFEAGQTQTAISIMEAVNREGMADRKDFFLLGELYKMSAREEPFSAEKFKLGHQKAIEIYDAMMKKFSGMETDPRPDHYAGWSYFELGDFKKAEQRFLQALKIDSNYAKAHFNLAMTWKEHNLGKTPGDYRRELKLAKEATLRHWSMDKGNPRIPYTLAIIYAVDGKEKEALKFLKEALRLDPLYSVRAKPEKWFEGLRKRENPNSKRYWALLAKYKPRPVGIQERVYRQYYDPSIFEE